jgi:hypothetical protein
MKYKQKFLNSYKKSLPTIFSKTDDFPADCDPENEKSSTRFLINIVFFLIEQRTICDEKHIEKQISNIISIKIIYFFKIINYFFKK